MSIPRLNGGIGLFHRRFAPLQLGCPRAPDGDSNRNDPLYGGLRLGHSNREREGHDPRVQARVPRGVGNLGDVPVGKSNDRQDR
jgi:hypothetical protein